MKLKFWIIVMLTLVVTTGAKAQKNHLTAFTQENLPTEMLTYLDQATSDKEKKKDNAKLIMEFGTVYSQLDGAMQKRMTAVCNTVLKLKVRQHPDVFNFIGTVNLMYTKGGRTNFDAWVGCLEFIQGRNKKIKDFTDFVEFTDQFVKTRTLYSSRSCSWQMQDGTTFRLQIEGGDIMVML